MAPFHATCTANVTIDCKAAEVHHHVARSSDAAGERMNRQELQGIGGPSKRGPPSWFATCIVSSSAPVHFSMTFLTISL